MKLIAVKRSQVLTVEVLDAAIAAAHETRKPIELLVESGDYFRTLSLAYFGWPRAIASGAHPTIAPTSWRKC